MKIQVTAYPYAVQYGEIEVPNDVTDVKKYIIENWGSIEFDEPNLDYKGTDFDCNEF